MSSVTRTVGMRPLFMPILSVALAFTTCLSSLGQTALSASPASQHPPIRVMVRFNNSPYSFINEDGQPAGLDVDVVRAAAEAVGRTVEIKTGCTHEMSASLESGEVDLLAGAYISEARKQSMAFSLSYISIDYGLFTAEDSGVVTLKDLSGKSIAVRRGDPLVEYIRLAESEDRITAVDNVKEALHLLSDGKRDCALLPRLLSLYSMQEEKFADTIHAQNSAVRLEYALASARENADLITQLNTGLTQLTESGRNAEIHAGWLDKLKEGPEQSYVEYAPHAVAVAAILVAVLLGLSGSIRYRAQGRRAEQRLSGVETEMWELKSVRKRLDAEKQSLISLLKNAPHGVVVINRIQTKPVVAYLNEAATRMTGYELDSVKDLPGFLKKVFPEQVYRERLLQRWERLAENAFKDGGFTVAFQNKFAESRRIDFQTGALGEGSVILMFSDVTERYEMQEQQRLLDEHIRQSQKLEAMGQLAGGVAHDFNNLLTSIFGNAQLLQMDLMDDPDKNEMVDQILIAAKRAGELTKQLLTYARKGKYQVKETDVHDVIGEVVKLLHHSINRLVNVELDLQAEAPIILGDSSQVQGALLNLGVNARDAMAEGGTLTYATSVVTLDEAACREYMHALTPGEYLQIIVSDTGSGMDKSVVERIFEPFFTTKEQGKGTGLGLAAVYGCVKNHRGSIKVDSAPGQGTVFTILFPTAGVKQGVKADRDAGQEIVKGKGHIMLVDDEENVRRLTAKALRKLGYLVTTLADGAEAADYYKEHHDEVDLVILDMIMPNMDGRAAFKEMKKVDPDVRVLVVSGFAAEETARVCMHEGALDFIAKPFWIGDLSQAVGTYIQPS